MISEKLKLIRQVVTPVQSHMLTDGRTADGRTDGRTDDTRHTIIPPTFIGPIKIINADPGGCMCIIYFLNSKCDTFLFLANAHDPENRFQKLNEIHRSRFSHSNCHTDLLTFVARSYHCRQALAMINNATKDLLAN